MRLLNAYVLRSTLLLLAVSSTANFAAQGTARENETTYKLMYIVDLVPQQGGARVEINIDNGKLLQKIRFDNSLDVYSDVRANGKLVIKDKQIYWELPAENAKLNYFAKLSHERTPGKFDARVTKDWALFRGDDLIPPIETVEVADAKAIAHLQFNLPESWKSVETGWPRVKGNLFVIDNPERLFDRPTGWMIAGNLGTRRATIKKTSVAVSAPANEGMRRMDALTFFNFVWPEVFKAFEKTPRKLLVVGAGDPMWRGGLSASNSLFLHSDRPLVSENGTSPLLHELTHMVTRISGKETSTGSDDWIAEGLAEYYSFELLYRADGMTKARRAKIISSLSRRGGAIKHLRQKKSTGAVTARAVVLFDDLDKEIRQRSKNKLNIDHVTRELMKMRKVSLDDLASISEKLVGSKLETLNSPLLK